MLGCCSTTVSHSSSHRRAHCGSLTKFKPVKSLSQYQTSRRFVCSKMCTTSCYFTTQTCNTLQASKIKDSYQNLLTVQLAKVVSEQKGKRKERSPVQYDPVQFIKLLKEVALLWDFTVIQWNKSKKKGSIQNQGLRLQTPQSLVKKRQPLKKKTDNWWLLPTPLTIVINYNYYVVEGPETFSCQGLDGLRRMLFSSPCSSTANTRCHSESCDLYELSLK